MTGGPPDDSSSDRSPREDSAEGSDRATSTRDLDDLLDAIHEHLVATQALPVERSAARWIGEAAAVARDLAEADLAPPVVTERLGHVESLLDEVETTDDATADEHLRRAKSLTGTALEVVESD